MDPKDSFVTGRQLEAATIFWYGELNRDNANAAELRLMRGEPINETQARTALWKHITEQMRTAKRNGEL